MFDYPGRIPRGSKTLSTLLHFKEPLFSGFYYFQTDDVAQTGGGYILGFIFQISDFSFKNGRGVYGEEMWMRGGREINIYILIKLYNIYII